MQLQGDEGWRLTVDPSRQPFAVLVGGPDWAAELSLVEARGLRDSLLRLRQQHDSLRSQLMAEEALELELERPLTAADGRACGELWLGLEAADCQGWALRFVLTPQPGQRAVEGHWPPQAALAFAAALIAHPLLEAAPSGA
ncbi:MAG: DUF1818 family protein [Synechococcaceae cyanobacterium]|nr:DUF1818 family protein [Synechococcaceae cyanobacterium]